MDNVGEKQSIAWPVREINADDSSLERHVEGHGTEHTHEYQERSCNDAKRREERVREEREEKRREEKRREEKRREGKREEIGGKGEGRREWGWDMHRNTRICFCLVLLHLTHEHSTIDHTYHNTRTDEHVSNLDDLVYLDYSHCLRGYR